MTDDSDLGAEANGGWYRHPDGTWHWYGRHDRPVCGAQTEGDGRGRSPYGTPPGACPTCKHGHVNLHTLARLYGFQTPLLMGEQKFARRRS